LDDAAVFRRQKRTVAFAPVTKMVRSQIYFGVHHQEINEDEVC